jgi:hypothetical protein
MKSHIEKLSNLYFADIDGIVGSGETKELALNSLIDNIHRMRSEMSENDYNYKCFQTFYPNAIKIV